MTLLQFELMRAAMTRYPFRAARSGEAPADYLAALVAHVEQRDYAAAHELRVGRPQAQWTQADVDSFTAHMKQRWGRAVDHSPETLMEDAYEFSMAVDGMPVSADALIKAGETALEFLIERRQVDPAAELPCLLQVLLTDGRCLMAPVHPDDRVALVKAVVQREPVFGFVVIADVFIHALGPTTATKRDALVCHIGTREMRRMLVRPYDVRDGHAHFDPDPPPMERFDGTVNKVYDPYAEVFVSVPLPSGEPS